MHPTTFEELPVGTCLARVYPRGTPLESCVEPLQYEFITCVTPPVPMLIKEDLIFLSKIIGASSVKCRPNTLLKAAKEKWPETTNIWWTHKGVPKYYPKLLEWPVSLKR